MQDIREEQLLMLLLVREAELDDGPEVFEIVVARLLEQPRHADIDEPPVLADLAGGRSREEAALRALRAADPSPRSTS